MNYSGLVLHLGPCLSDDPMLTFLSPSLLSNGKKNHHFPKVGNVHLKDLWPEAG